MDEPRGDAVEWKRLLEYPTLLERGALSNSMGHDRKLDATKQQIKYPDIVPEFDEDDTSFGERFAVRHQQPKFSDESWMPPKSYRRSSVDRSFAHSGYNKEVEGQRGWSTGRTPWLLGQRSATSAGRKRSLASNDVTLDAAINKVKELIARRRLLEKWLTQVRFA